MAFGLQIACYKFLNTFSSKHNSETKEAEGPPHTEMPELEASFLLLTEIKSIGHANNRYIFQASGLSAITCKDLHDLFWLTFWHIKI